MLSQRFFARASQRTATQFRPIIRKRFNHTMPDNKFNRERAAQVEHAVSTKDLWRKLSIYVTIPCIILSGINAYNLWVEHWEHWDHMPPLEERVEYPFQNIRTKNFFWGNGDRTLFWNPEVNYHNKDKVV